MQFPKLICNVSLVLHLEPQGTSPLLWILECGEHSFLNAIPPPEGYGWPQPHCLLLHHLRRSSSLIESVLCDYTPFNIYFEGGCECHSGWLTIIPPTSTVTQGRSRKVPTAGWGSAHSPDRLLPQDPFGELLGQVPLRAHNIEGIRAEQGHGAHTTGSIGEKLRECAKVIK